MLNEHQLSIMRRNYPGFKDKDTVMRRVKADQQRYKEQVGWIPFKDAEETTHA